MPRDLSNVTIFLKSFLRHGLLRDCVAGIRSNLPECQILIVDDSSGTSGLKMTKDNVAYFGEFDKSIEGNITTIFMPFDSGFGAKSNEMIHHLNTEYVLIGSDDFDFRNAREGIEKLHTVLEDCASLSVASGRVNDNPYESIFQFREGQNFVREIPGYYGSWLAQGVEYKPCDLTVNYSLIRSSNLGFNRTQVHWDEDVKIGGGEHAAFFLDLYWAGHGVCYVPGVNISELPYDSAKVDPRYQGFRNRASQPGRICLKRRGIDVYGLSDGTEENS